MHLSSSSVKRWNVFLEVKGTQIRRGTSASWLGLEAELAG
jgi:hypothetical protein